MKAIVALFRCLFSQLADLFHMLTTNERKLEEIEQRYDL